MRSAPWSHSAATDFLGAISTSVAPRATELSSLVHHLSTEMSISGVHPGHEVMPEGTERCLRARSDA
jgi:hypothetical protein